MIESLVTGLLKLLAETFATLVNNYSPARLVRRLISGTTLSYDPAGFWWHLLWQGLDISSWFLVLASIIMLFRLFA